MLSRQHGFTLNESEKAYLNNCIELRERERREKEEHNRRELEVARKLADEQSHSAKRHTDLCF